MKLFCFGEARVEIVISEILGFAIGDDFESIMLDGGLARIEIPYLILSYLPLFGAPGI